MKDGHHVGLDFCEILIEALSVLQIPSREGTRRAWEFDPKQSRDCEHFAPHATRQLYEKDNKNGMRSTLDRAYDTWSRTGPVAGLQSQSAEVVSGPDMHTTKQQAAGTACETRPPRAKPFVSEATPAASYHHINGRVSVSGATLNPQTPVPRRR
jgi:hypothetical protein